MLTNDVCVLVRRREDDAALCGLLSVINDGLNLALRSRLIALSECGFAYVLVGRILVPTLRSADDRLSASDDLRVLFIRLRLFDRVRSLRGVLVLLVASNARRNDGERLLLAIGVDVRRVISIDDGLGPTALR